MIKFTKSITAGDLADMLGAPLSSGDADVIVSGISTLDEATPSSMSFVAEPGYISRLNETAAGLVLVCTGMKTDGLSCAVLESENPRMLIARILNELCVKDDAAPSGVLESARISKSANVSDSAFVGENVVIGERVVVQDNAVILHNTVIMNDAVIGARTKVHPNVTIYNDVHIGSDCIIHSNTTIGSQGFGYANDRGRWESLPHLAKVIIGNNVEVGSNTSIDRGFLTDTVVADGVIIDNQVQIGHNVKIGTNTAVAGCTAIAGSAKVGAHCMIGGASKIAGHLSITDGVILTGGTLVNNSIKEPGVFSSGMFAKPRNIWQKNIARFHKINDMAVKLRELEKKIKELSGTQIVEADDE